MGLGFQLPVDEERARNAGEIGREDVDGGKPSARS